jgi:hypothetical protein
MPSPNLSELETLDHSALMAMREMYTGNQEMQNLISQYEHQAFTRESTAENPMMAIPYAVAIPGYNIYKQMTGAGRSKPSMGQVVGGYKGIYQGLMQRLQSKLAR